MKNETFEDFLMEKHAEGYTGLDDDMSDNFNDWICDLDSQEIIDYAEVYGMEKFNAGMKEVIDQI